MRTDEPFIVLAAALAAAVFVASWSVVRSRVDTGREIVDTPIYQSYGDAMVGGQVPYRDFRLEYPPGALPVFAVPALIRTDEAPDSYKRAFEWLMGGFGAAIVLLTVAALLALRAERARLAAVLAFAALWPLVFGPVFLTRFDLWPAVLALAALTAFVTGFDRIGSGVLGAALAVKLFPGVLAPLAAVWVWRRRGRRELLVCGGVFAAVLVVAFAPFLALSPGGLVGSVTRQLSRPLQIESLGAAALVGLHHVAGIDIAVESSHGSQNLDGGLTDAVALGTTALELAALVAVWLAFARGPATRERLVRYTALALVVLVAFGKVLSPQFMIWLVPFVPLVAGRRGIAAAGLLAVALALTHAWFPYRYWEYAQGLGEGVTWLVLARDVVLVALAGVLAAPSRWALAPARMRAPVRPAHTRRALPRS